MTADIAMPWLDQASRLDETPIEPLIPAVSSEADRLFDDVPPLSFDDPRLDWCNDDDPFAELGPVEAEPGGDAGPSGAPL